MNSVKIAEEENERFLKDIETESESSNPPSRTKTRSRGCCFLDVCFYPVTIILLLGIVMLALRLETLSHAVAPPDPTLDITQSEENPCGTTANVARNRGCLFDPLTFAWLPPACYDYNLTADFLKVQDWSWWRERPDGSRRQLSLINVMQSSDEVLYVNWEYHRQHCVFMWKKLHRAMLSGGVIDGLTMWEGITGVCDGVLRDSRDGNDTSVPGYVRFPSCKEH